MSRKGLGAAGSRSHTRLGLVRWGIFSPQGTPCWLALLFLLVVTLKHEGLWGWSILALKLQWGYSAQRLRGAAGGFPEAGLP